MKRINPAKKHRLSRRQGQILDAIRASLREKGWPPSIREIGDATGLSSSSTVHSHLRNLERWGYIKRNPSQPRSIQLVEQGPSRVDQLLALVAGAAPFVERGLPTACGEAARVWLEQAASFLPIPVPVEDRLEGFSCEVADEGDCLNCGTRLDTYPCPARVEAATDVEPICEGRR